MTTVLSPPRDVQPTTPTASHMSVPSTKVRHIYNIGIFLPITNQLGSIFIGSKFLSQPYFWIPAAGAVEFEMSFEIVNSSSYSFNINMLTERNMQTRSQAVARIADRTASQYRWGHVTSSLM